MTHSKLEVLTPQNCQLIFIDHEPQMAFGVQSIDRQTLKNNVVALAKAAKAFKVPTTITTVETESFSGHTYPELLAVFPDSKIIERVARLQARSQPYLAQIRQESSNSRVVALLNTIERHTAAISARSAWRSCSARWPFRSMWFLDLSPPGQSPNSNSSARIF